VTASEQINCFSINRDYAQASLWISIGLSTVQGLENTANSAFPDRFQQGENRFDQCFMAAFCQTDKA
jgi:hypothetical protein